MTETALRVTVIGDQAWKDRVRKFDKDVGDAVESAVQIGLLALRGDMQRRVSGLSADAEGEVDASHADDLRSGKIKFTRVGADGVVLNKRTGTLFRSINARFRRSGADSSGEVGTPIVYAKTHELGLTIKFPKRGISIKYPKRPFVKPAFDELAPTIIQNIQRGLDRAARA